MNKTFAVLQLSLFFAQEIKNEVVAESRVGKHCFNFSLSDSSVREYAVTCSHPHDQYCCSCEMRDKSLEQYRQLLMKLCPSDSFEDRQLRHKMIEDIDYIKEWVKHEVRGVAQNEAEKKILEQLTSDGRSGYLCFDLAMKWLPRLYRETMLQWFGQRGLGWQVGLPMHGQTWVQAWLCCTVFP